MQIWRRALVGCLLILGVLAYTSIRPAAAADARFSLTTSPLPINLTVTPGHTASDTVRVQNASAVPEHIRVSILKFKAAGTDGRPLLLKPGPADEFVKWISFSPAEFTARPNEWTDVKLIASPPLGSGLGYYFAVVFSNANLPAPTTRSPGNVLNGAVATMVLMDVHVPGEKLAVSVTSFSATKKLYEYLPATFSVTLKNSGNIHGIPSGSIFISNAGHNIGTLDLNPAGGNILPDSSRVFTVSWSDGFPVFKDKIVNGQVATDKKGNNVERLNWDFSKLGHLRFGHYTARFSGTYDNGSQDVPIGAIVSFWVIPWKLILIILVTLGLVLFGIFSGLRNGFRRRKK